MLRGVFLFLNVLIFSLGAFADYASECTNQLKGTYSSGDPNDETSTPTCRLSSGKVLQVSDLKTFSEFSSNCPEGSTGGYSSERGFICVDDGSVSVTSNKPSSTDNTESAASDCDSAALDVKSYCMEANDSGMNQVMQMAQVFSRNMGMASSADIATACSGMGSLSTMANGAIATFKGVCLAKVSTCQTACTNAKDSKNLNICNDASKKAKGLDTDILLATYTANNAKRCADQTGGNPWQKLCRQNPTMAGCSTSQHSCSDPAFASTSVVCICQANPRDSRCGTTAGMPGDSSVNLSSTGAPPNAPGMDLGLTNPSAGLGMNTGTSADGLGGGSGNSSAGGGGGGMGSSGGGGVGKGSPTKGAAGGSAASAYNTKVNNGYYGANGPTTAGGANNSANSGGGGQFGSNGNNANKIDLRQFLPGGKFDPRRGLAGISGPDGITGPSSDLFAKVNIRYHAVLPSLRP